MALSGFLRISVVLLLGMQDVVHGSAPESFALIQQRATKHHSVQEIPDADLREAGLFQIDSERYMVIMELNVDMDSPNESAASNSSWFPKLGEYMYYVGPNKTFNAADKHTYGERVKVFGRQTCGQANAWYKCPDRIYVQFRGNNHSSAVFRGNLAEEMPGDEHKAFELFQSDVARFYANMELNLDMESSEDVAANSSWHPKPGSLVYFVGPTNTFNGGDKHNHGDRVKVFGRQTCAQSNSWYKCAERFIVQFPGNARTSAVFVGNLAEEMPRDELKNFELMPGDKHNAFELFQTDVERFYRHWNEQLA